jgi:protein sidekick
VRAEGVNSTTIRVWWKPPDPQLINGINQGYKLQAWRGIFKLSRWQLSFVSYF